MIRALLLMLIAWPLLIVAAPLPPGIIGEDDRRVIDGADQRRWNAVGRLNLEGGGFCSAVLVGPREALTAAHCLWDHRRHRWLLPEMVHFVPGYRRGNYLGHARGAAFRLAETIEISSDGKPTDLVDDWAVVTLDLNLEAGAGITPLDVAGASDRARLNLSTPLLRPGYSRDRPYLPVLVDPCRALGTSGQGRLLLHDCDATLGDSGSPILVRQDGRLLVLGVQSSVVTLEGEEAGVAVMIEKQVPADTLRDGKH